MAAEKNFENKVKKYLSDMGAWTVKYFANAYTRAGIPDVLVCYHGKFIGIEVKAQNGRPSELQLHEIRQIRRAGGQAFVLYPSAFEDFRDWLENDMPFEPLEIWK